MQNTKKQMIAVRNACYQAIPDNLSTTETTMYSPIQGVTFSYQVLKIFPMLSVKNLVIYEAFY